MNRKKIVPMTVKKTTKKAAPKNYPKKKTPPKSRRITLDDLAAVVAETEARMARAREETERAFRKSREETEARIAKSREETEARIAKSREETDKALQELSAQNEKTTADILKTSVIVRELSRNMGGLNNSFGYVVELIAVPKLRSAINAAGHTFTHENVWVDKKINALVAGEKKTIGEIDMFLLNETEAMAVEIKAQLNTSHIEERLKRLEKIRTYEEEAEIKGLTLYGAVAGVYIDPKAKDMALKTAYTSWKSARKKIN